MWRRYVGEVEKFLPYFVANLSKTLHISFYQNRSSIVEVMIKKFWCVFLCLRVVLIVFTSDHFCFYSVVIDMKSIHFAGSENNCETTKSLKKRLSIRPHSH